MYFSCLQKKNAKFAKNTTCMRKIHALQYREMSQEFQISIFFSILMSNVKIHFLWLKITIFSIFQLYVNMMCNTHLSVQEEQRTSRCQLMESCDLMNFSPLKVLRYIKYLKIQPHENKIQELQGFPYFPSPFIKKINIYHENI